nr:hypothetical protein [uncultured Mucilaginibacter sp.]
MLELKPGDILLLLEVFRSGLISGIIGKEDVVKWADGIIIDATKPDYFFIELALAADKNALIEILDRYDLNADNAICTRVLLGCVYRKLVNDNDPLTIEAAAGLINRLQNYDQLTNFEITQIYIFDDHDIYYQPDLLQQRKDTISFLAIYEPFNLSNYSEWADINIRVEKVLDEKQKQADIDNEAFIKSYKQRERKKKLVLYFIITIVGAVLVGLLFYVVKSLHAPEGFSSFYVILLVILVRGAVYRLGK